MTGGLKASIFERGARRFRRLLSRPRGSAGFTIIEVLIVLAVTGFLFVGAALLIAGRQSQTEFNQAIRQVQTQIQQVINDVAVGYYPNTNNFVCTVSGTNPPTVSPGVSEQGTNSDCIFIGKTIQFDVAGTSPEQFKVYTMVGRRLSSTGSGDDSQNRAQAKPIAVAPNTTDPNVPDNSETFQLNGGLTTYSMVWGASSNPIGSVGFMQSLAPPIAGESGAQIIRVIPVTNSTLNVTSPQGVTQINDNFATSAYDPLGVRICFVSAGTNQSGLISIGGAQRQLSVTLNIKSNKTCS